MEEPRGRRIRESAGDAIVDAIRRAGRRGRRPLPRHHMVPAPTTAPHGRARRPRRAAHTGTPTGTPSGTRAAGDVGPSHAHMVPAPTTAPHGAGPYHAPHGRARRPRRAAHTGTPTGTSSGTRGRTRGRHQARGPPGTSAPTTLHMVGRDVPGAPRTRGRPRGRHQARGPPGTSAPTTLHMVGRDVPGAPRTRGRPRGRHQARGPPRTSAPTTAPYGRARRPRRAAHTGTPTGTPSGTRAASVSATEHGPCQRLGGVTGNREVSESA